MTYPPQIQPYPIHQHPGPLPVGPMPVGHLPNPFPFHHQPAVSPVYQQQHQQPEVGFQNPPLFPGSCPYPRATSTSMTTTSIDGLPVIIRKYEQ